MIVNINTPFPESQKLIVSKILKKKRRKKEKKEIIFSQSSFHVILNYSLITKKPHKSTNIKRQAMLFLQRDDLDNHRFYYISSA